MYPFRLTQRMPSGSTKHKLAFKGATIMTALARYHAANLPELMERINKNSIGMDDYFDRFFNTDGTNSNYPPYNLVQVSNVLSKHWYSGLFTPSKQ